MAESDLHKRMKDDAAKELSQQGYSVIAEPLFAPSRFLSWNAYRPDLLGIKSDATHQDYALVECETHPSTRKLVSKNFRSLQVQSRLDACLSVRRILVVPRGSLRRLDSRLRYSWEMWIHGDAFEKIPARLPRRTAVEPLMGPLLHIPHAPPILLCRKGFEGRSNIMTPDGHVRRLGTLVS